MDTNAFFNMPKADENQQAPVQVETEKTSKKGSNNKKELVAKFKQAVDADPNMMTVLHSKSGDLMVIKTLSSKTIDNLIKDKTVTTERKLIRVDGLCGYRLKNIGQEPITYKTEVYTKDANGIYVGEVVEKTAAPGEEFDLARKYMTLLTCQPEYSFTLANGTMKAGGGTDKCSTVDEKLEKPHFQFAADENGVVVSVHDDSVKVPVEDTDGNILPEFEATFGYLHNPTANVTGGKKSGGSKNKISTQELTANYFRMLVEGNNGMQ